MSEDIAEIAAKLTKEAQDWVLRPAWDGWSSPGPAPSKSVIAELVAEKLAERKGVMLHSTELSKVLRDHLLTHENGGAK